MDNSKFQKIQKSDIKLDESIIKSIPHTNNMHDIISISKQNKFFKEFQLEKEAKEAEELRRHNELVSALKEAGKNGANIIIGDNAYDIQIQQNSSSSSQKMNNSNEFDYEKTLDVLNEIKGYTELPQFNNAFNDNSIYIKKLIDETISATEKREDSSLIRKSLNILKDLCVGISGSLIATGICSLLIPIL